MFAYVFPRILDNIGQESVAFDSAAQPDNPRRSCPLSNGGYQDGETRSGYGPRKSGRTVEAEVHRHGFTVIRALEGHGIGRTIHEPPSVPNYWNPEQKDVLTEGLVLTIEPIISCGSGQAFEDGDGWTVRTKDGSLSAHYEHTVVITRDRPVLLTAA